MISGCLQQKGAYVDVLADKSTSRREKVKSVQLQSVNTVMRVTLVTSMLVRRLSESSTELVSFYFAFKASACSSF